MAVDWYASPPSTELITLSFACVVLAAGAGKRFGRPKAEALLPDGTTFLVAVARTAKEAGADPVVVVIPAGRGAPRGTSAVTNPDPASEQIDSLRLGLQQLADGAAAGTLVWPVDCPLVRSETVSAVLRAAEATAAPIAVPTSAGRRGHPTYFARSTWPQLMAAGAGGARQVLRMRARELVEVPVDDPGILHDIDSVIDLSRVAGQAAP